MDSTETYLLNGTWSVWPQYHEAGLYVSAVNSLPTEEYGANSLYKAKTDKADAMKIARYALDNWVNLRDYTPMGTIRYDLIPILVKKYKCFL